MGKYELVFILDSRLSDGEKSEVAKQVTDLMAKVGGKVINSTVWIDRQRMAFPIKKAMEGTYYLTNVEFPCNEVARFRRELQNNERVLRFLLIAIEEKKAEKQA